MTAWTHSQLATKLVVEGCLASVAGRVQGKMPMEPIVLTELERADIGLAQGGDTVFYPLPPTGVFLDLAGTRATVWFNDADAGKALAGFEGAMKQAFSSVRQLHDSAHPKDPKIRWRAYEVDFGNSRLALLEVEYPEPGAERPRFLVRVVPQLRKQ